jgi:hypothetical protein
VSRTTVTLDPDVDAMLQTLVRERGVASEVAVDSALWLADALSRFDARVVVPDAARS